MTALEEYIARVVSEAPPLTPAQRDKLAVLLRATTPLKPSGREEPPRVTPIGGGVTAGRFVL